MYYFDNAATSVKKPDCVIEAVCEAMKNMGNSGRGVNEASLHAARTVFSVRAQLAEFFGGENAACFAFTANATESLNIAIKGTLKPGDHVITTVLEHNSVLRPLYEMQEKGIELTILSCDETGMVYPDQFERAVRKNTKAIVCTHASNLTGNVTDIESIGKTARKNGILFIVDASQTAGFLDIDVQKQNIDILCFTGHKSLLGPQGTGGIYVRQGVTVKPLKTGGSGIQTYHKHHPVQMPTALEAGTLNGHGICGLGAALNYIKNTGIETIREKEMKLMNRFLEGVRKIPGVKIYGNFECKERCPIVCVNIGGRDSAMIGDELYNEYGVSVRTGGHCAPLMHEALGTKEQGAVRFSFSYYNTEEEIDYVLEALKNITE